MSHNHRSADVLREDIELTAVEITGKCSVVRCELFCDCVASVSGNRLPHTNLSRYVLTATACKWRVLFLYLCTHCTQPRGARNVGNSSGWSMLSAPGRAERAAATVL